MNQYMGREVYEWIIYARGQKRIPYHLPGQIVDTVYLPEYWKKIVKLVSFF